MSISLEAIWAASPTTTRGQPTQLSCDPKGERIAYASNKSIFLRNIDDTAISTHYTQHVTNTTVARFSPSGFYVASGDVAGNVKIWDCVGEGVTKGDYNIIAGRINDLAWDGDSQRIIAVGSGRERMGHCIAADSGNSVGEISGHSAQINSVSIRPMRPLRAATGSDDTTTVFYHGAPFKYNTSLRGQHDRFVYGTAFSPDGSLLVTVGADKKIWLYDGKTGEAKASVGEGVHAGSIFGVSWGADSKEFVTASADKTVRVWDVETAKAVQTWNMAEDGKASIDSQQVGVVWPANRSDDLIISVDLGGNLNYLNKGTPKPSRVVRGHQRNITAATITNDETLWTGSSEGRILAWNISQGAAEKVDGEPHKNYIAALSTDAKSQDQVYTATWDDRLHKIDSTKRVITQDSVSLNGQPKGLSVTSSSVVVVATQSSLDMYAKSGELLKSHPTKFSTTCVAASSDITAVGSDDKIVRLFDASDPNSIKQLQELRDATSSLSVVSFAANGKYLAAGTSNGKIYVYECSDPADVSAEWKLLTSRWSAHTARITCIAWRGDGSAAASGSLDTNVYVWSVADPGKRIVARNAHKEGVSVVQWSENKVLSAGADASVKIWNIKGV